MGDENENSTARGLEVGELHQLPIPLLGPTTAELLAGEIRRLKRRCPHRAESSWCRECAWNDAIERAAKLVEGAAK